MSSAGNTQPTGMAKKSFGHDNGSDLSCSTVPDDGKETAASDQQRPRKSSSPSAPPGSLNFTIKSVMPTSSLTAGSSISNASTQRVDQPTQPRGRSNHTNSKSRHAVHFAGKGGVKQPGEEDPVQDRSRKAVASPPPPSATAFSRNPAAAAAAAAAAASVNPERERVVEVPVRAGDGLSKIGTREFASRSSPGLDPDDGDPRSNHERRSSAPPAVPSTSFRSKGAVAKANVKKGWGPRQRAVAEAAALARMREGAEAGGSSSSNAEAPTATGTFVNQSRLPKLEIPPLGETLQRYLGAVAPLLSPEAFAVTKNVVKEVRRRGKCRCVVVRDGMGPPPAPGVVLRNGCSWACAGIEVVFSPAPQRLQKQHVAPWLHRVAGAASCLKVGRGMFRFKSGPAPYNMIVFCAALMSAKRHARRVVSGKMCGSSTTLFHIDAHVHNMRLSCWMFRTQQRR